MKKTLALVLALALVFSSITVAFAEGTIGAEAQIAADLGMLKGETGTVDAAYVATAPTRLQSAVMFLRLKGLEAEALAFTGEANFADGNIAWAEGSNLLAYLKANPQLGWVGDGKNFNPNGKITAKEYYKVLLETLGYKQNTAEVVGDFTWDNVVEFAAGKGLSKVAAVTDYTVNDLAIATVEALKATVKDGGKTLVASLVEAGKIDAAKATAAGLLTETTTTTAKLDAVKAVANDKVEVTFDADADKAFAENVANYSIVVKGSTTALEVKSAKAENGTLVVLETAAQTAGTAYTLKVGEVSKNFAGISKQTGAPELDTVKCIDTNTVELVFKKAMDRSTVEDVANYTLNNGATVKAAELWVDQDDTRMTVKLTTEGVAKNRIYKLKVANVKSSDGVAIKTVEKSFAGTADTTAIKFLGNVIVKNNQRIWVKIDDAHGIDKATAEDLVNWSINDLTIEKVIAKDYPDDKSFGYYTDDYGYYDYVEIQTSPMTSGHSYTVTGSNLKDGSISGNVIAKPLTKSFKGVSEDKTIPTVKYIDVVGDDMIDIQFTENNRLDPTSLTDVSNYTFDKDITVLEASVLKASTPDVQNGKTVVLKTSTMEENKIYKLTVANVADEFGNVMKTTTRSVVGEKDDIASPYVKSVLWVDKTHVKLTFNERLDADSAQDVANYSVNGDLGTIKKAELSTGDVSASSGDTSFRVVTLTTAEQTVNSKYTVTINNVKDRAGNACFNTKAYFTAARTSADSTKPEVASIDVISKNEVRVTFDEVVKTVGTSVMTVSYGSTPTLTTLRSSGQPLDDETTIVYRTDNVGGTPFASLWALADNTKYTITGLTNVKDDSNNTYVLPSTADYFYGINTDNQPAELSTKEQVNPKEFKFIFDKPVQEINPLTTITGNGQTFDVDVDVDDENTTDAESTVTLTIQGVANAIVFDKDYDFDLSTILTDYAGQAVVDEGVDGNTNITRVTSYISDEDAAVIDYAEAVDTKTIKVYYNEDVRSDAVGSYRIYEGDTALNLTLVAKRDGTDYNVVNVTITGGADISKYKADQVYDIKPTTGARDYAGNLSSVEDIVHSFVASPVVNDQYIKGVKIVDSKKILVTLNAYLDSNDTISVKKSVTGAPELAIEGTLAATAEYLDTAKAYNEFTVNLTQALQDNVKYTVTLTPVAGGADAHSTAPLTGTETYTFEGVVADGGLDVSSAGIITFSGMDINKYVVKVVYDGQEFTVLPDKANNRFDMATFYADATAGAYTANTGYAYTSILGLSKYTVEVYRLDTAIDMVEADATDPDTDVNTIVEYRAEIAPAGLEGVVVNSREFTK